MKKDKGSKSLAEIARQHGISEAKVVQEIQDAIDVAMTNPDPKIREFWAKIPCQGGKPTPEEAIVYFAKSIGRYRG